MAHREESENKSNILGQVQGISTQKVKSVFFKTSKHDLIAVIMHGVNIKEEYLSKIKPLNNEMARLQTKQKF